MKNYSTPVHWHIEKHNKVVWQDSGGPGNTTYATSYPVTLIIHEQLGDPRLRTCVAQLDNSTESEANAHLIAAAPELLEACKAALRANPYGVKFDGKWDDWRDQVSAAISKAEGK